LSLLADGDSSRASNAQPRALAGNADTCACRARQHTRWRAISFSLRRAGPRRNLPRTGGDEPQALILGGGADSQDREGTRWDESWGRDRKRASWKTRAAGAHCRKRAPRKKIIEHLAFGDPGMHGRRGKGDSRDPRRARRQHAIPRNRPHGRSAR